MNIKVLSTILLLFISSQVANANSNNKKNSPKNITQKNNSSCSFTTVSKGSNKALKKIEFKKSSIEYKYSKGQIITVGHKHPSATGEKDTYSIEYKSVSNIEKPQEHSLFVLECNGILNCSAYKKMIYPSYKKEKILKIDPRSNSVALPYGGRSLFTFERDINSFQFIFVDIYVNTANWNGVKIDCTY